MFTAEMNIHFPELENIDTPTVWVFPPVAICSNCGASEFVVHGEPLRELREGLLRRLKIERVEPSE